MNKLFFLISALYLAASAQDLTVSKDSIQVYNNLVSSSFADQVTFTSHSSAPIRLDSVFVMIAEMDTAGYGHKEFQIAWNSALSGAQQFVWTMDSIGPNSFRLAKRVFYPSTAEPLVFSGNGQPGQISFLEIGYCFICEVFPMYPRFVKGSMRFFFSNQQVVDLKLWSHDYRLAYSINPDSLLSKTTIPFDTTIINLIRVTDSNRVIVKGNVMASMSSFAPVTIRRYGLTFVLYRPYTMTICPLPLWGDFVPGESDTARIKYPKDQTQLYRANDCCGNVPRCTSWAKIDTSILTHEYRFPTASSYLYMKVLDGSRPDSIKLRFDTSSFLQANAIRMPDLARPQKKSPFSLHNNNVLAALRRGSLNATSITVYSMTGKNITASAMNRNLIGKSGIVIVKINANGGSYYSREVLVK
jgi:hypothetical protein